MVRKVINSNTVAHFKGDYVDDNKEKAKERRHLLLEREVDNLLFLKLTSEKRKELNQIRIHPDDVECLNKVSYPVFNRRVSISLADLEIANYQYFYDCPLHPKGCLKEEEFIRISQRFKALWEDELTLDKKLISVDPSKLKPTKEIPWWVNYADKERTKPRQV